MKRKDIFESIVDVGSGFILGVTIQLLVFPLFGLHPTILENITIALIFMCTSMIRSALWRMYFRRRSND